MRLNTLAFLILILIMTSSNSWAATVYYCEMLEDLIIVNHKGGRGNNVGKKFKMEVIGPTQYPGGSVKFSEGAPIGGEYEILASWGGVGEKFIAREKDVRSGFINFYKGDVTYINIADLSLFDGPIVGNTSSSKCEKF